MSTTHFSSSNRGLTLSLLAFTLVVSLWAISSSFPILYGNNDVSATYAAPCEDGADVMASLDRSRNGISLTCNSETLSGSKAR